MDSLVRAFSTFLSRDAVYIVGGTVVLSAGYVLFRFSLPIDNAPAAALIVTLGLGHSVGFALQGIGAMVGAVTISANPAPTGWLRFLVRKFTRRNVWFTSEPLADDRFAEFSSTRTQEEFDRIITLKQISATMGSCSIAIAILILAKWCVFPGVHPPSAVSFVGTLVMAAILCPMSYIMAAQQTHFLAIKGMHARISREAEAQGRARVAAGFPGSELDDWRVAECNIRKRAEVLMKTGIMPEEPPCCASPSLLSSNASR